MNHLMRRSDLLQSCESIFGGMIQLNRVTTTVNTCDHASKSDQPKSFLPYFLFQMIRVSLVYLASCWRDLFVLFIYNK